MPQVRKQKAARQQILIAAGSNMTSVWGDPEATLRKAFARLSDVVGEAVVMSDLYATPAFPAGAGPDYVNAAASFYSDLAPDTLMALLHRIEADALRERSRRWGQRTLDLDLIAVGGQVLPDVATFAIWRDLPLQEQIKQTPQDLIVPHPRMQDRAFVLVPLAQIASDWVHPVSGRTVVQMRDACPAEDQASVRRLPVA